MITWMQRHKKWLVITIWISTIAFVGAGFVGWGSYEYGKQGGVVAVVGDRNISVEEYQQEYSNLYEQYARVFGNMFNEEMANKMNLKDTAYSQVVQKNLILSFADSLGLDATNEDVAKQLVKYEAFLKDGKFDKETYIKVLNQNRTTPLEFEESLKRNIILQKIQVLFDIQPNKKEIENLSKLLFLEDDIVYKIINSQDIKVEVDQEELKKYWEEHKDSYKSEISYDLEIAKMSIAPSNPTEEEILEHYNNFKSDFTKDDGLIKTLEEARADIVKVLDEKASKTEALKKFLRIKKSEENLDEKVTYTINTLPFDSETNGKIIESQKDEILKPILFNNEFVIIKVLNKNDSVTLSFEEALSEVEKDFLIIQKDKKLDEFAQNELKTFSGTKVSSVTRESIDKIIYLQPQEAAKFLSELFSSKSKEGIVKLDDKVVLFRVLESRFAKYDESKDDVVKSTLVQIQDEELMMNLIKRLENFYEIQSSIQVKDQ